MEGIIIRHTSCGTQYRCADCGRWCRDNENIRHSSRCDTPDVQPDVQPEASQGALEDTSHAPKDLGSREIARAAEEGTLPLILNDDEIAEAAYFGYISVSQAMNQDF